MKNKKNEVEKDERKIIPPDGPSSKCNGVTEFWPQLPNLIKYFILSWIAQFNINHYNGSQTRIIIMNKT